MAYLTRAEELVQTVDGDAAFQAELESAPTVTAKRQVLDAHGFQDIDLDDMRAYIESRGGQLNIPGGGRELTERELAAVAGGLTQDEILGISIGLPVVVSAAAAAV